MARDWGLSLLQFLLHHSWIYGHPGYLHMYFPFKFSKSVSIIHSLAPKTFWCISIKEPKPHVLNTDFKNEREGLSKMHFHYFYLAYFLYIFFFPTPSIGKICSTFPYILQLFDIITYLFYLWEVIYKFVNIHIANLFHTSFTALIHI